MNAKDIKVVSIFGAGTMGSGIAQVFAQKGYSVFVKDISDEFLATCRKRITQSLDKLVERSKISAEDKQTALNRITFTTDAVLAVKSADFLVEAVPEKLEWKKEIFKEAAKSGKPELIIATNTSTLSITELAAVSANPQNFIGMHFMNPVPLMSLVEIIVGLLTSAETIKIVTELTVALGKEPIIVKDSPGFATTRLGVALFMEASRMLEEGVASVADIDKAMRTGYGHRMGPFETCDLVGLDARLNNINALYEATKEQTWKPPQLLKKLVSAGFLGKKPGSKGGYYDYFGLKTG